MLDQLRYHRRPLLVSGALLVGLLVLLGVVAVAMRLGGGTPSHDAKPQPTSVTQQPRGSRAEATTTGAPTATDVASWDAIPPVVPEASAAYPAIDAAARRDPDAFARAFAVELFTHDYGVSTRAQLISWAQYEDAPLRSPRYPSADWTKVLVDSLTDLSWDSAQDTPIQPDGPWLALRSEQARQTVGDVKVSLDPRWEQKIADGYQPPDPLATVRDVALTISQRTAVGARTAVSTFSVALDLQLGSSARGNGYGVAATNNYVIKEVG